jgi:hypothetical protein
MKKLIFSILAAGVLSTTAAIAADKVTKAPMMPPPPPSPWDVAFGGGLMSDYIFRGITQSAHNPSLTAYFEPRYNINKDLQLYAGISGESIDFPNRAAAEIDLYGGIVRPSTSLPSISGSGNTGIRAANVSMVACSRFSARIVLRTVTCR